jgi:hypothetical protein
MVQTPVTTIVSVCLIPPDIEFSPDLARKSSAGPSGLKTGTLLGCGGSGFFFRGLGVIKGLGAGVVTFLVILGAWVPFVLIVGVVRLTVEGCVVIG